MLLSFHATAEFSCYSNDTEIISDISIDHFLLWSDIILFAYSKGCASQKKTLAQNKVKK